MTSWEIPEINGKNRKPCYQKIFLQEDCYPKSSPNHDLKFWGTPLVRNLCTKKSNPPGIVIVDVSTLWGATIPCILFFIQWVILAMKRMIHNLARDCQRLLLQIISNGYGSIPMKIPFLGGYSHP